MPVDDIILFIEPRQSPWINGCLVYWTAGKSVRSPLFGNIFFGDEDKVEQFVEQHPSRSGERTNGVWLLLSLLIIIIFL